MPFSPKRISFDSIQSAALCEANREADVREVDGRSPVTPGSASVPGGRGQCFGAGCFQKDISLPWLSLPSLPAGGGGPFTGSRWFEAPTTGNVYMI